VTLSTSPTIGLEQSNILHFQFAGPQGKQVTYGPAHFLCHFGPDKRCQTDADNVPRMSNVLRRTSEVLTSPDPVAAAAARGL